MLWFKQFDMLELSKNIMIKFPLVIVYNNKNREFWNEVKIKIIHKKCFIPKLDFRSYEICLFSKRPSIEFYIIKLNTSHYLIIFCYNKRELSKSMLLKYFFIKHIIYKIYSRLPLIFDAFIFIFNTNTVHYQHEKNT